MDYQNAYSRLMQAIRKAPDNSAQGFKIQVYKLVIICELFIGETPSRSLFSQPEFKERYLFYFLTLACIPIMSWSSVCSREALASLMKFW